MKCFVCGGSISPFCKKKFDFMGEWINEYVKCNDCGMVISKTFYEMNKERWIELNNEGHKTYQGTDENEVDPRWIQRITEQVNVLTRMFELGLLKKDSSCVDYGCGDGKLADKFNATSSRVKILKYDKYMQGVLEAKDYLSDDALSDRKWDVVINCSVLEHIIGRKDLDEIMNLLDDDGVICLHTLICENVPQDSEWFYFLLGHCTIWTNKSMEYVYKQYGFKGCAYNLESRFWFFFKNNYMMRNIQSMRNELDGEWVFSDNFIDYWKQQPYRN